MRLFVHAAGVFALLISLSTGLFSERDPSAFFFPTELEALTSAGDSITCWVSPVANGKGMEQATGVTYYMNEVWDILKASSSRMVKPKQYHTNLKQHLDSSMILAYDNLFHPWFKALSGRNDVNDTFVGLYAPWPVGIIRTVDCMILLNKSIVAAGYGAAFVRRVDVDTRSL